MPQAANYQLDSPKRFFEAVVRLRGASHWRYRDAISTLLDELTNLWLRERGASGLGPQFDAQPWRSAIGTWMEKFCEFKKACSCGATIYFFHTRRGKTAPYDDQALNHFATCPNGRAYRKPPREHEGTFLDEVR